MHPAEQAKLRLEVLTLERVYKADEANGIQREAREAVVRSEEREVPVGEDDVLRFPLGSVY